MTQLLCERRQGTTGLSCGIRTGAYVEMGKFGNSGQCAHAGVCKRPVYQGQGAQMREVKQYWRELCGDRGGAIVET